MAKFNLTGSKTVAELKKEFNEAFGSRLKVYNKNKTAEDTTTLGELGLKADTEFECRSSRTVGSFNNAFAEMGLKVKVYTKDEWVAVLSGITLETSAKIPNQSTTEKMKEYLAYQRDEACEDVASEDAPASEDSGETHTYYLRLESERFWRFDTVNLENADDDDIAEAFEDRTRWTEIIGDTKCLYVQKDYLEEACGKDCDADEISQKYFGDNEAVQHIVDMIGDNYVNTSHYFADAEEEFRIVVLDEDENEIETVESSDIPSFSCEQGFQADLYLYDYDEGDDEYPVIEKYLEMAYNPEKREHVFTPADENSWFWLNIQDCCAMGDFPEYKLETKGEFDPSKLSVKKVSVEEAVSGLLFIECVNEVLYDGEPLEVVSEHADEEEGTNLLIKVASEGVNPEKAYDMTNYEES